mmetsp:Transcript_38599/g.110949  ORF Transcript_38599/g.110949 Transcript_38599/m.110949 type:complete len:290 (-) Transcript_38599:61-930(-)
MSAHSTRADQADVFTLCDAVRRAASDKHALLDELMGVAQEVLTGTYLRRWTHDRSFRALRPAERELTPAGFKVSSVAVVTGAGYTGLRKRYDGALRRRQGVRIRGGEYTVLTQNWSQELDESVNEWLLLHGTTEEAAEAITRHGFNLKCATPDSVCGKAIYMAESSTKADEYASPVKAGGERVIIFCRVLGGHVRYVDDPKPDKGERSGDTVLNDREKSRGTFREFVVFQEHHVCPELIVRYQHTGSLQLRPRMRRAVSERGLPFRSSAPVARRLPAVHDDEGSQSSDS